MYLYKFPFTFTTKRKTSEEKYKQQTPLCKRSLWASYNLVLRASLPSLGAPRNGKREPGDEVSNVYFFSGNRVRYLVPVSWRDVVVSCPQIGGCHDEIHVEICVIIL